MKVFLNGMLAATFLLSVSMVANAATLSSGEGVVMVNHGAGYAPFKGELLSTGDQVLVRSGKNASIDYGKGCVMPLVAGKTLTITNELPCLNNLQASGVAPVGYNGAAGDGQGAGPLGFDPMYLLGGAVVIGAVFAIVEISNNSDTKRVSP